MEAAIDPLLSWSEIQPGAIQRQCSPDGAQRNPGLARERRRPHPPGRMPLAQLLRARGCRAARVEQRKAGRARARHAREPAAGQAAKLGQHIGDHRRKLDRGRFEIVAVIGQGREQRRALLAADRPARRRRAHLRAGSRASAANTSLVATATPGLTSTAGNRGRSSGSESISPIPRMKRGRTSRQTGTSAPVAAPPPSGVDHRASCGWRARAAARPRRRRRTRHRARRHRQPFRQRETAELEAVNPLGQRARP